MTAAAGLAAARLASIEREQREALRRAAPRFDLAALLDVLRLMGYEPPQIELRSHATTTHQPALIRAIDFLEHPTRVRITLNIGLLSAPGPLPSYFLQVIGQQRGESLEEFIGFFDHWLLRDLVASLYPERDPRLFPDFDATRKRLLQIQALRAPSTVHWIMQRAFPELAIAVRRAVHKRTLITTGVRIGSAILGEGCTFGGETHTPTAGVDIFCVAEEEHCATGAPWGVEAHRRLHAQVLPLLRGSGLMMNVWLLITDAGGLARLSEDRFLGHDPMGIQGTESSRSQSILLHSGDIP